MRGRSEVRPSVNEKTKSWVREHGLESCRKRRFKATTDSKHVLPVATNILDRNFEVAAPDVAWVTDITCVWTDEGWLYLAAILDLFSRRVVGHAMSKHMDRGLVLAALRLAPDQDALVDLDAVCSMSRKGNCWDSESRRASSPR